MNAKAIATAYLKAKELHEASYDKTWNECANEATPDQDIAFIVYMAHITGFSDWHAWATEVLSRPEKRRTRGEGKV